ncbi:hypothetical protein [Pseudogulbenkiania subflava]|uniref:Uncharacterized protein n=1 Tax=Pseudogulbenkiania subflava DSM 22618 TaxID=1123014 RepID=A0A1Y6C9P9_9NEIS|nr:hypothetical protein [Pseudogulbenkiania subflava]SMF53306.1 hypothetical protein SAMN02745746_03807 [Pseudogulbenkiania subflava DSM 22618]
MNTFEYRIFYRWDGPSHSDPMASEKSPKEIICALREFRNELAHRLQDPDADTKASEPQEGQKEVHLRVRTTESLDSVNCALQETLSGWRLYGELLHEQQG